jgi:hypothetical protein
MKGIDLWLRRSYPYENHMRQRDSVGFFRPYGLTPVDSLPVHQLCRSRIRTRLEGVWIGSGTVRVVIAA